MFVQRIIPLLEIVSPIKNPEMIDGINMVIEELNNLNTFFQKLSDYILLFVY